MFRYKLFVCCSFVCSFVYLFDRLFVCVSCSFSFVSFSVSLVFDVQCSDKCQNLNEYFVKNRQFYNFLCVHLKPTTFGVSFPEVIMIANVFTPQKRQILWFPYNIVKQKLWRLNAKKNIVTRQTEFVGVSYNFKTTPFKYATIHITF